MLFPSSNPCVIYIVTLLVFFGRYNDVLAYPNNYASYHVSVRQYRILPFGFLHCIPHGKPPCHLLILLGVTQAYKGFTPSGKITLVVFMLSKVYLYIWTFSTAYNRCALLMQGAHKNYMSIGVSVRTTKFAARNNGFGVRSRVLGTIPNCI